MLYGMLNHNEKILTRDIIPGPRSRADERAHMRQMVADLRQAVSLSWANNHWLLYDKDDKLIRSGITWEFYQVAKAFGLQILYRHRW